MHLPEARLKKWIASQLFFYKTMSCSAAMMSLTGAHNEIEPLS